MYLKRLRLHNFKSFAGTTEVPFSQGFTGVAGPNGMGKSNISDAILFVLGPPSSKALRADRLTRLFFDGGKDGSGKEGKPATECEASLIFDNSDRAMAVDADEVELTRYVKLAPNNPEGYYSYFYVNGRRSTQTEMDALLARARLSAEGYNVIQQGEVNRIIAMSPLERRLLTERLAGIAQYDEDLAKAGDKRTQVETNMTQLGTLLAEVERHLSELDGQRTQAIRYRDLAATKKNLEVALARSNMNKLRQEVATSQKRQAELGADVEKLTQKLATVKEKKAQLLSKIAEVESQIATRGGEEAVRIQGEKSARMLEVGKFEIELEKAKEALGLATESRSKLEKELASRRKELKGFEDKVAKFTQEVASVEKRLQDHSRSLENANETKDISQRAVQMKRSLMVNEQEQSTRGEAWKRALQRLETAKAELASLEHEKAIAEEDLKVRQAEVKDLEYRLRSATSSRKGGEHSIDGLTNELHTLKARERSLSSTAERLKGELLELNRSYAGLEAKLKERGASGGSPTFATDFLLTQRNLGKLGGIRGKVEDLVTVESEYATAISIAGGNRLKSLVVDTDETAAQCIELLNREKKGRVTFLPLNKMTPSRPKGKSLVVQHAPGCRGFALDVVKFDNAIESALSFVFGETLIMDTLENARKQMGGVRLVTLRGELMEASGAMSGGFLGNAGRAKGIENAATLNRLSEELGSKSTEEVKVLSELKTVSQRLKEVAEELARHSGEVTGSASTINEVQQDLSRFRERLKSAEERCTAADRSVTQLARDLEGAAAESTSLQNALDALKATHEELQKQYLDYLPSTLSARVKKLQEEGQGLNDERVALHRDLEGARSTSTASSETLRAREEESETLKQAVITKTSEIKQIEKSLAEAREKLAAIDLVLESQTQASRALTQKKDAFMNELTLVASDEGATSTKLQTQQSVLSEFQVRLDTLRASVEEAERSVQDLPDLPKELASKTPEELRRAAAEAAEALTSLGAVNTLAIEQYDAEKRRLDEFQGEVARLKEEREGLVALVQQLEEKKRTRLKEVIGGVDENYRKIYTELSGGGEGELVMEDPDDPLKGGLLIRARPLGKKVARIEQLSGGEKSLASLAFIFALQRYDPSPMYVLDEVDMSLDGINAENIGRMLRRNSGKAQFVVISLRKVTLKWAEHLFGVTMRGDGRSQIVGIRLDDIVDVDERELNAEATRQIPPLKPGGEAA